MDFFPVWLTAKTCLWSFVLFLVLGLPLSLWLARKKNFCTRVVEFLVSLPLVFPPIALGYMLLLALGRSSPLGAALESLGVRMVFSQVGVIFAAFIAGLALFERPVQVALESAALKELEEAARVCGANRLKTFFFVTLPLIKNSLLAGLLLGLARASGEVGITMMLGGNVQGRSNTLSLEIFNSVSRADFDTATFLCGILAAFALVVYVLLCFVQSRKTL